MYGFARTDEHYVVDQNFNLEGIILKMHSGKKGIHKPKDLLSEETPHFEIHMINPYPEPRKIN